MAAKKGSSCFGLFIKSFILCSLILAVLAAAGLMIAIKFFQADPNIWLVFTSWDSRPLLVIYGILGTSALLGIFVGMAGAAVSVLFAGGDKKGSSSTPARKARPQSNRKTTL